MNTIKYIKQVPLFKKVFGTSLIIVGLIFVLTSSIMFGLIAMVIGINIIVTDGSEINLENKTYRKLKSFYGLDFGKWQTCPKFEYVSVFKTKISQKVTVVTASTTFTDDVILLNLFYGNKNITFYQTNNKEDAFKVAYHFKMALDIDILDATEKEKKWL